METPPLLQRFLRARALRHGLFWLASFWVILKLTSPSQLESIDYLYTAFFHLSLVVAVYGNLQLAIPRLLDRARYVLYGLTFVGLIGIGVALNWATFQYLTDWLAPGYYFVSSYDWIQRVEFIGAYLSISCLLHLSQAWFEVQTTRQQLAELAEAHSRAQLDRLKAQINPHFLFNTLHNLHSLARSGHSETAQSILQLAEMLRYLTYEAQAERVPLSREITYLNNYLALQRLRIGPEAKVTFEVEGTCEAIRLAPLLMMPLVENAFKHGRPSKTESYIDLRIWCKAESLCMFVENGKVPLPDVDDQPGGVGLANLRDRLALLYPHTHTLQVTDLPDRFSVKLDIQFTSPIHFFNASTE